MIDLDHVFYEHKDIIICVSSITALIPKDGRPVGGGYAEYTEVWLKGDPNRIVIRQPVARTWREIQDRLRTR